MKLIEDMNIGELAAFVCSFLKEHGIKCVLTGGACVSIYTDNKYQSYDLDFIERYYKSRKEIKNVLSKIGFEEKNRYFTHKDTKYFLEFPSGPLSAGSEPITEINELEFETGKLILLTPTDCIKDRLAAYYHWSDNQALEQAVWISENCKIDVKELERWSKTEKKSKEFKVIKGRLLNKLQ